MNALKWKCPNFFILWSTHMYKGGERERQLIILEINSLPMWIDVEVEIVIET